MAHVGVERLGRRSPPEHGAQDEEAAAHSSVRKRDGVPGLSAARTPALARCATIPSSGEDDEPDDHDRPEQRPTHAVPRLWITNSATRMASVSGTTKGSSPGVATSQALHGAEHGDRRRDHAVAVEQRGAEDAERTSSRRSQPRLALDRRGARAPVSARMPPSPWLSARMMSVRT